jgi:hypothetical protein
LPWAGKLRRDPYTVEHELDEKGERQLNEKAGGAQSGASV